MVLIHKKDRCPHDPYTMHCNDFYDLKKKINKTTDCYKENADVESNVKFLPQDIYDCVLM